MPDTAPATGALDGRVAVIDIGSNSIRLVVFDAAKRSALTVFNEKVLCGLGRGIVETGRLSAEGVTLALENLRRFRLLTEAMHVGRIEVVATAAVREAANGQEFVGQIRRLTGFEPRVLSGKEEARLSALGMLASIVGADGFLGDLGGGSLELVDVARGEILENVTLPLGPLRLIDSAGGSLRRGREQIDKALKGLGWVDRLKGRRFYAVGGAWRMFARILMSLQDYPLHVIHQYSLSAEELAGLLDRYRALSKEEIRRIPNTSRRRLETLPWAVLVLERVFALAAPSRLVFSAAGLREGCVYDLLPAEEKAADPLLCAARDLSGGGRFQLGEAELFAFLAPALGPFTPPVERLTRAACVLADIAWTEHPDYRAEQAFLRVLRLPIFGIDHQERAFLALAIAARYGGALEDGFTNIAAQLLDGTRARLAMQIGAGLRLAFSLSGGAPGVLASARLALSERTLALALPPDGSVVPGDAVMRRLETLARLAGATPVIRSAFGTADAAA